jgi:hypothetical protein
MKGCYACKALPLAPVFDAGQQPIGNRFLKSPQETEATYPLRVVQCAACGLLQMREPFPAAELQPAYDWVTYSEPEDHLDELADVIRALPGITPDSVIAGVSFKDDTTLDRLERRGLTKRWRLDLRDDLELTWVHGGHGAETIQAYLTVDAARRVAAKRGAADVLLVRHIAEHAYDPREFFGAWAALIKPGGYIVIEVPDCQRALDTGDCTTLWEEHTLYFTPGTFQQTLRLLGLEPVFFRNYIYPFENSLVAIVRVAAPAAADAGIAGEEMARGKGFAARLAGRRAALRDYLERHRATKGRIAMFGAGHLAVTFLTIMNAPGLIDFVVDDNPNKRGLFMPGSRLPIVGSDVLHASPDVTLCLLGLNPLSEQKVMDRQAAFTARGGVFKSVFPSSAVALEI